jgi:hypothetical protein
MTRIQHFLRTHVALLVFLASGILGLVIFTLVFGWSVVNPTNISWIQSDAGDLGQHYIGWLFYRQAEWTFPLGAIPNLAYPHGIALTFMDSIPLLAIPLKLFSPILPETFQYFGVWGAASYFLQGGIAGLIILRLTKKFGVSVIGSVFFSLSPIVMARMFGHTALAGHWIILSAILLALYSKTLTLKKFIILWSVMLSVAVCVHPYFIPMAWVVLASTAVICFKKWQDLVLRIVVPTVAAIAVFWAIGGFLVKDIASDGLGAFAINFNTLVDPMGWSAFFSPLPTNPGSYEGFAYLGAGILFLTIIFIYKIVMFKDKSYLRRQIKQYMTRRWICVYILFFCLLVASISPIINVNDHQLVLHFPMVVENIWAIFRATGRLFWPIYYMLILVILTGSYWVLMKKSRYMYVLLFFYFALLLQGYDILNSDMAKARHGVFASSVKTAYVAKINIAKWTDIAKGRSHLQYIDPAPKDTFFSIAYFAHDHHMTMSDGYFARSPAKDIYQASNQAKMTVLAGKVGMDTVYVTNNDDVSKYVVGSDKFISFQDAGLTVFAAKNNRQ